MTHHKNNAARIFSFLFGILPLVSLPFVCVQAVADEQPFDPPGGLPIIVNSASPQAQLDLDGDMEADFLIYRDTTFGNGFAIFGYLTSNNFSVNKIRSYILNTDPPRDYKLALRYDSTEIVTNSGYTDDGGPALFFPGQQIPGATSLFLDFTSDSGARTFVPFRDNPGFISLAFGTNVNGDLEEIGGAWLEIVVSSDGSELQILSGVWDDNRGRTELLLP